MKINRQQPQELKPTATNPTKARKNKKFIGLSVKSLDSSVIKKNYSSKYTTVQQKKIDKRTIDRRLPNEVKAILQAKNPEKKLEEIQARISKESHTKLTPTTKNREYLNKRIASAKNALKLAKALQQSAALIAFDRDNQETKKTNQHALQVYNEASAAVNMKKTELKKATLDLKKYDNARHSKGKIRKEANSLIKRSDKLAKKEFTPKNNSLESHQTHLKKLIEQKKRLKHSIKREKNILDNMPRKQRKHGYNLSKVTARIKTSIKVTSQKLEDISKNIDQSKLLIKSMKLSQARQKLITEKNKVDQQLRRY